MFSCSPLLSSLCLGVSVVHFFRTLLSVLNPRRFLMKAHEVEELRVYPAGDQFVIHVPNGRGEELRVHLASHGIRSKVSPPALKSFERLEVKGDVDAEAL